MSAVITSAQPKPVERYEQFFGFGEAPFSLAPNPRYLFESASHGAALAQVAYAIERREPLVVVTGEIGTGKTLLCRTVLQRLERKTFVAVINNPLLERDDLLKQLLQDFGVISKDRTKMMAMSRHDLVHALEDFLASLAPLQAHAVVVIDEAQHIRPDVLEQIRLLSNIDDERGTMLQIILVGQADLESLLSRPELRQFQQRVSRRFRLEPLGADELRLYIEHRLAVGRGVSTQSQMPGVKELERAMAEWEGTAAGGTFTPDAIHAVWTLSGGLPRVVNVLCDRALEAACARRSRTIDAALITTAALAVDLRSQPPPVDPAPVPEPVEAGDQAIPIAVEAAAFAAPGRRRIVALIAAMSVAAVVIWLGTRALSPAGDRERVVNPDTPVPPAPALLQGGRAGRPDGGPAPAPASAVATVPAPAAAAPTTPRSETAAGGSIAADGDVTNGQFEIVVASFRTDARAATVVAAVSNLGLPVRRRVIGGWHQVIAGPFASRAAADEVQQRLTGAGLTQTVVVRQNQTARG
jgi:general secretion pathway protein A